MMTVKLEARSSKLEARKGFSSSFQLSASSNIRLLKKVEFQLKSAKVLSPRVEAETLLTHFAGMDRMELFTSRTAVSAPALRRIQKVLATRKKGTPLSYLTGLAPFYGRQFKVTKDTLIPRPETEVLVEETLRILRTEYVGKTSKVLDIGTGSGCIAVSLTLEYPECRMTALDASLKALRVARRNAESFGVRRQIRFVQSRLFDAFGKGRSGPWDLIVSNPPYVPREAWTRLSREVKSEPRLALDGGRGGLEIIFRILEQAPAFLSDHGWLLMEIGKGQSRPIEKKLKRSGDYKRFYFVKDLNGIDRVLIAQHG